MKPLILILLAGVVAQAQTIADIARSSRNRKVQGKSTWSFRTEDIKGKTPDIPDAPPVAPPAGGPPVENSAPAAAVPSAVDPVQKWNEETNKMRARIRDLMDQETAAQLQIDNLTTQIHSPVTTQSAVDQAQAGLQAAQQRLTTIRTDLTTAGGELQQRELQGPPKSNPPR